jgi:8-oxo-dGTP diphosphatase
MELKRLCYWLKNKPAIKEKKNCPCYDKDGNFIGWFSRSVAVVTFVFCRNEKEEWCILGSERGREAADYQGYWNAPCGFLDFNETTRQAAIREMLEETGVQLTESELACIGFQDDPVKSNNQNVTFRYVALINDRITTDFSFSHEGNEGNEVGEIKWIPLDKVGDYKWAFGHEDLITGIAKSLNINKLN